jgi:hypothetical protein
MSRRRVIPSLLVLIMLLLLASGILRIYHLRMARGDAFPNHSSLRADPIGTRLLFESLQEARITRTKRNFNALEKLELPASPTTLLLIGASMNTAPSTDWTPRETANQLSRFAARGGHIVIALHPIYQRLRTHDKTNEVTCSKSSEGCGTTNHWEEANSNFIDSVTWIGAEVTLDPRPETRSHADRTPQAPPHLPDTLPCRTDAVLQGLSDTWVPIYAREGLPVIAQRPFGKGSFTLSTLSYFLTNQALRDHRETTAVLWLLHDADTVIFDETHLGLQSQRLTAELLREHRLQWVLLATALTGILFAWRTSSSLLPKQRDTGNHPLCDKTHSTHDARLALLRRHLPPRHLLRELVNLWETHDDAHSTRCAHILREARTVADKESNASLHTPTHILDAYHALVEKVQQARHGHTIEENKDDSTKGANHDT